MHDHLIDAPRDTELASGEPEAAALQNRRNLAASAKERLGLTAQRRSLRVIELRSHLGLAANVHLYLLRRRVRLGVAILVLGELDGAAEHLAHHLEVQIIILEPLTTVLEALRLGEVLKCDHHLVIVCNLAVAIIASQIQINAVVGVAGLLAVQASEDVEAVRAAHLNCRLNQYLATLIVQEAGLGASLLVHLDRAHGEGDCIEGLRCNNGCHSVCVVC